MVDGFKLFYYGVIDTTAIEGVEAYPQNNEVEGYYTLSGMRIAQPTQGITIVKYKNGRTVKMMK